VVDLVINKRINKVTAQLSNGLPLASEKFADGRGTKTAGDIHSLAEVGDDALIN
jgi:hypothetical protein